MVQLGRNFKKFRDIRKSINSKMSQQYSKINNKADNITQQAFYKCNKVLS